VKHVALFQAEQWTKLLSRLETRVTSPVFDALLIDRDTLFALRVGMNASLGRVLVDLGLSRTLDYRSHTPHILMRLTEKIETERRRRLFEAEGRAFWTELGPTASLPATFKQVLTKLSPESVRIFTLLLADALCWSALKKPTGTCLFLPGEVHHGSFLQLSQIFSL
jgi:hypothetical protein